MNSKPKFELLKNRSIGSIITDTFSFFQLNFKSLFSGLFYICSPALLISCIGGFLFFNKYLNFVQSVTNPSRTEIPFENGDMGEVVAMIPSILLMFLGTYVFMSFIIVVTYSYIKLYKQEEEINTSSLWDTSKKYIWKIIGAQFLLTIIILIAYAICCLPIFLFALGNGAGIAGSFLALILFLVFIIALFYFYVKLAFYQHYIIVEDKGIIESLKLSYNFSNGIFWKIFLPSFVLYLIISIGGSILQTPGFILMFIGMVTGLTQENNDVSFINLLAAALISVGIMMSYLLYSLVYTGISITYYSTIEERHGIKANEEVEKIGESQD